MIHYSAAVIDHFFAPRCVGEFAKNELSIYRATAGSVSEGSQITLQLQIESDIIVATRFKAFGNPYLIAACSYICEYLPGKTRTAAAAISYQEVVAALEIPKPEYASAILLEQALQRALARGDEHE